MSYQAGKTPISPPTFSLTFPSTKLYLFLIFVAFSISYLFPHIFSQEKLTSFLGVSDFLKPSFPSHENPLFSPCMHPAAESKKSNDCQERRRRDKRPPAASPGRGSLPARSHALQSHSAGARHTLLLAWKNVLSTALRTESAPAQHPHTWAGGSGAALGSHLSTYTTPQLLQHAAGRTRSVFPSPCLAFPSWLNSDLCVKDT